MAGLSLAALLPFHVTVEAVPVTGAAARYTEAHGVYAVVTGAVLASAVCKRTRHLCQEESLGTKFALTTT